jgi:hypothetical protein
MAGPPRMRAACTAIPDMPAKLRPVNAKVRDSFAERFDVDKTSDEPLPEDGGGKRHWPKVGYNHETSSYWVPTT